MKEDVPLAPFTTFHIGGPARFFVEAETEKEIEDALAFARKRNLPCFVLGGGSNLLVPDSGIDGVVLRITTRNIEFENDDNDVLLVAAAGTAWNIVVDEVGARGIFGIENLAGIPGTVGGAAVQNIGAYGVELANVFEYADIIDSTTGARKRITRREAAFAYRTSFFKERRECVITRVALRFSRSEVPNISYPDLVCVRASGEPLSTPAEIARAVRAIRAKKFPQSAEEGTAGSFFKNPIVSRELAGSLAERFPGLPVFPQKDGGVKVPLAWILDHILALKGFKKGHVRMYEKQPLVIVTSVGATAAEVDAFANEIAERVFKITGITIEREVETLGE